MNRRFVMLGATAALALPVPAMAFVAYDTSDPITAALRAGKTVFVDYAADWCSTCARQERIINALRQSNPAYDENIVFIRVDWDQFKGAPVTRDRGVPRRSTLLVLRGSEELGRIIAGTREADIKRLMDRALAAATAS